MMAQRNEQAGMTGDGGRGAGSEAGHGYGARDDAAVTEGAAGQPIAEAPVVEERGTGADPDGGDLMVDGVIVDEDGTEPGALGGGEHAGVHETVGERASGTRPRDHSGPGLAAAPASAVPSPGDTASPADPAAGRVADAQTVPGIPDLSQRWHEIQATFVDDPRGSVELAAEAAEEAVASLVGVIKQRQESLLSASGQAASGGSTEQLRSTLQDYRTLCRSIEDFAGQLTQLIAASAR
ncbi:MAG TPA: hypothetical protein VH307_25800 [Streptosporangiaceae bacterium]|jgi:hypothetical protein|nr:hypothetical protein [Streptosporangiaceae bacterium]